MDDHSEEILTSVQSIDTKVSSLDTKASSISTNIDSINTEFSKLDSKIESSNNTLSSIDNKVDLTDVKSKLNTIDTKLESIDTFGKDIKSTTVSIESKLDTLSTKESGISTKLDELTQISDRIVYQNGTVNSINDKLDDVSKIKESLFLLSKLEVLDNVDGKLDLLDNLTRLYKLDSLELIVDLLKSGVGLLSSINSAIQEIKETTYKLLTTDTEDYYLMVLEALVAEAKATNQTKIIWAHPMINVIRDYCVEHGYIVTPYFSANPSNQSGRLWLITLPQA